MWRLARSDISTLVDGEPQVTKIASISPGPVCQGITAEQYSHFWPKTSGAETSMSEWKHGTPANRVSHIMSHFESMRWHLLHCITFVSHIVVMFSLWVPPLSVSKSVRRKYVDENRPPGLRAGGIYLQGQEASSQLVTHRTSFVSY